MQTSEFEVNVICIAKSFKVKNEARMTEERKGDVCLNF